MCIMSTITLAFDGKNLFYTLLLDSDWDASPMQGYLQNCLRAAF